MIDLSKYKNKDERIAFLIENKDVLKAQKAATFKKADCFYNFSGFEKSLKANNPIDQQSINALSKLNVIAIINTTNYMDSHNDVHIKGLWKKSLQENKMIMHLQEHVMSFDHIISEGRNLKSYTQDFSWAELGYNWVGNTEALVFDSIIERKRNEYMMLQYANGYVKNHSVGMYYVKFDLAANNDEYPNEYEAWNKYYPEIVNKKRADEMGFFWYILEAKAIEGSAVPIGSNQITPTYENNKNEPDLSTQLNAEPLQNTLKYLNENIKIY